MPELLLELFSEEIPARMQGRAAEDLRRLVTDGLKAPGSPRQTSTAARQRRQERLEGRWRGRHRRIRNHAGQIHCWSVRSPRELASIGIHRLSVVYTRLSYEVG